MDAKQHNLVDTPSNFLILVLTCFYEMDIQSTKYQSGQFHPSMIKLWHTIPQNKLPHTLIFAMIYNCMVPCFRSTHNTALTYLPCHANSVVLYKFLLVVAYYPRYHMSITLHLYIFHHCWLLSPVTLHNCVEGGCLQNFELHN